MPATNKRSRIAADPSATVSVAHAKANLSSLLSRVEKKRDPVTILRRGVPIAQIVPLPSTSVPQFVGSMVGTAQVHGDIVSPTGEEWTVGEWPSPHSPTDADPDEN